MVTENIEKEEALDSEDDKKIRRAEKRALQKRKERRSRRMTIQPGYFLVISVLASLAITLFVPFARTTYHSCSRLHQRSRH